MHSNRCLSIERALPFRLPRLPRERKSAKMHSQRHAKMNETIGPPRRNSSTTTRDDAQTALLDARWLQSSIDASSSSLLLSVMEMMSLTRGSLSLSCARAPLKVRSWWVFGVGFSFFLTWHRREILLHLSFFFSPATNKQEGVFGHFGPKKGKNKKDKNISLVMNEKVKRVTISDTKKQVPTFQRLSSIQSNARLI